MGEQRSTTDQHNKQRLFLLAPGSPDSNVSCDSGQGKSGDREHSESDPDQGKALDSSRACRGVTRAREMMYLPS